MSGQSGVPCRWRPLLTCWLRQANLRGFLDVVKHDFRSDKTSVSKHSVMMRVSATGRKSLQDEAVCFSIVMMMVMVLKL